jgi:diphosphomevalonate decarboxylase
MFTNNKVKYKSTDHYKVTYQSPSNIALVKYWGKHGNQLPCNPSLSVTLENAHTLTTMEISPKIGESYSINFLFEGEKRPDFAQKIEKHFENILEFFPFITDYDFKIESTNTFPHSSGIASSASSMSALAMCLCDIEKGLSKEPLDENYQLTKASYISRLGSGSACRSVYGKMSMWGEFQSESSDEYGMAISEYHPCFEGICDSIAIISKEEKSVSSRAGHALMNDHPFAAVRFENATNNLAKLMTAFKDGDFNSFAEIVESEALELHGLMMNSNPSFILMKPNTLEAISRIRKFRQQFDAKVCFTLDAGPNVHILYLKEDENRVKAFIEDEIVELCASNLVIHDHMGNGPLRIK